VLNQYNISVKYLWSNNARKYIAATSGFQSFMDSHGIIYQTSSSYTSQKNAVIERKNQNLVDVARCLMLHMHLPKFFWGHVFLQRDI